MDRTLIIYAATGNSSNLDFFLRHGLKEDADYLFVGVSGPPNFRLIREQGDKITLWCRGLRESPNYRRYLLLSDELRGPILPLWSSRKEGWHTCFTELLNRDIKLGGATISYDRDFRVDPGAMVIDSSLVPLFLEDPSNITARALEVGNIACLMLLYKGRDFRKQRDPIYTEYHPFEVIFAPLSDRVERYSSWMEGLDLPVSRGINDKEYIERRARDRQRIREEQWRTYREVYERKEREEHEKKEREERERKDETKEDPIDWRQYLLMNRDVCRVECSRDFALNHWELHGKKEGRTTQTPYPFVFDWRNYIARYEDLRRAGISDYTSALHHYLNHGVDEGRDPT